MPPLSKKSSKRSKLSPRDDSAWATEQQIRRQRGEIACLECTQRKSKCNKQIPCQSCCKKGRAALCPNGTVPTGKRARSMLAQRDERIRQLENALSEAHAKYSTEPHPLLPPDLLGASQRERENDVGPPFAHDPAFVEHTPELVEASGTPFTSDSSASRSFETAGDSYCSSMIEDMQYPGSEELGFPWFEPHGSMASAEQMREELAWDQTPYPDTSSQFAASPQTLPPRHMQARLETPVLPSYSGEELGSPRPPQPSSVASLGQTQEMSNSTPTQFSAFFQMPPHVPSEVSARGGLAAGSSTSAHHGHRPPTFFTSSTASYHDAPFVAASTYHYRSQPHHLIQPPPRQHQPTHLDPPQSHPVLLFPSELAQLGPVAQGSELDQHQVSSTKFGFSMDNGYQG
ncbi:hypothetical protein EDD17DRAFT_1059569 [Pisolithus thermaeus]|nr:hypothetical protein EDD17DRAFT_1059569 [Pisolithus thermaeus]